MEVARNQTPESVHLFLASGDVELVPLIDFNSAVKASGSEIQTIVQPDTFNEIDESDIEDITDLDMEKEIVPESDIDEPLTSDYDGEDKDEPSVEQIANVIAYMMKNKAFN
ncbi:hypothetical protein PQC36_gp055 [Proteus phage Vb_PmiP-P59]|uniref:Uncharacterized protein n=1 Tax=Proteus phage Vb_PmiP-P59 TaxID=2754975 RepID=A0A7G5CG23_9CAUD|nr:hypothetical protein PQC36_gp055 [Proteus phage Vb_PmiP-P59]QMV48225.1 hypothetical protein [Proteus phage Vb_PmiP-P59]